MTRGEERICRTCGAKFKELAWKRKMFCSPVCRNHFTKDRRLCPGCGKEFWVSKSSFKIYCSVRCYHESQLKEKAECKICHRDLSDIPKENYIHTDKMCWICWHKHAHKISSLTQ